MLCKCILVAEDQDDVRETLADILQNEGYEVHTAKNGKEALEKLQKIPGPVLILLDLMMPVMNGWEFLDAQKANARFASHQIVTVSAIPATESLEDTTPLKTAGRLEKPLRLNKLLDQVRHFCETPAQAS